MRVYRTNCIMPTVDTYSLVIRITQMDKERRIYVLAFKMH